MIHEQGRNMNKPLESDILKDTISNFSKLTGGKIKPRLSPKPAVDAYVQITLGNQTSDFLVEIKNEIRQTHIPAIIQQFGRETEKWLLVARYIPAPQKERLKAASINYLETAGNCYINVTGMFIYINDREVSSSRQTDSGRLWSATGLKFLFAILSKNALLTSPYRQIAQAAGIALGSIGPLLEELKEGGHIESIEGSTRLLDKEKLIRRWIELFHVTLRPKLMKGRFRFFDKQQQDKWKSLQATTFYWSGEAGADLLTNYLEPETFTIYSSGTTNELIKQLKLIPDIEGNIEVLEQYWDDSLLKDHNLPEGIAPPLIIYAELMAGTDSRTWETAEKIKNKYLYGN
ncbi:type IV toxin-antitoxin system AbiEi family antitoxin [Chitinophaga ginsengisoli]|uniref:Transcriptional regulator with AbiEi antitoxin domain of type IV toxin-antitoxin system n=1 Tax=Chitinophaga ginsengisoli TaxID=363837 RepID=A0A2P8GPD1_9BACT|nr:type IV toxin-antitoxin system AbiEi family antitoxin [Chitinophaga ginsengisoli]PSL35816.1 hypothetical protein CLV42_101578 [Chitinophaga ginsengisoli]